MDDLKVSTTFDVSPRFAFDVFTARLGDFWPIAYTFSGPAFADAALQPRSGGEWYERDLQGHRLSWGKVLEFEPGRRVVLEFAIGPERKPVPSDHASIVELSFLPAYPEGTRLDVVHRQFERHGDSAEHMRQGMASEQGWPLILAELRRGIRRAARECPPAS